MASRSASVRLPTASRTATSCIAATTSRASRTCALSSELTVVERPGWATTSPASREPQQRLADRSTADAEPGRELQVAQLLAGGERAVDDGVAQATVDVVAQQAAVERGTSRGSACNILTPWLGNLDLLPAIDMQYIACR